MAAWTITSAPRTKACRSGSRWAPPSASPPGVVLFMMTNSWAMVAVGAVLGLVTAAVPSGRSRPEKDGPPADQG